MGKLENRTAIVTGGARGIGWHYADALAAEGAKVMICDITDGTAAARDISKLRGEGAVTFGHCDVSDEASVKAFVGEAVQRLGGIDILVNNAALMATLEVQSVCDIDVAVWDKVMAVNVRGPFLMVKHVAPHMRAKRYGKIINISSGVANRGLAEFAHYTTSKGAVTSLTRALSRELGEHRICVNTISPGFTMTEGILGNAGMEKWRQPILQSRAIKREQLPEDLRGAIVFLASGDSDFITGQTISVCGGAINT